MKRYKLRGNFLIIAVFLAQLVFAQSSEDSLLIALSGDEAPGLNSTFQSFEEVYINEQGAIWFKAYAENGNFGWWQKGESIEPLLLSTESIGGLSGEITNVELIIDNSGNRVALVFATGPEWVLLKGSPANWQVVVRSGDIVTPVRQYITEGNDPVDFELYENPENIRLLINNGHIAVFAERLFQLNSRNTFGGILGIDPAGEKSFQVVSDLRGRTFPEIQENAILYGYGGYDTGFWNPTINNSGKFALVYNYSYEDSAIQRRAFTVHDASETLFQVLADDYRTEFENVRFTTSSNDGRTAAIGSFPDGSNGIWIYSEGEPERVVSGGDIAPETAGATFNAFSSLNFLDNDRFIFRASVVQADEENWGIWYYDGAGIYKIQLQGDSAPELGIDAEFQNPLYYSVDTSGRIAIWNGNFTGDAGLWTGLVGEEIELITRPGDQLQFGNGDVRSVMHVKRGASTSPNYSNGANGIPTAINSTGNQVYNIEFTDGSSALVTGVKKSTSIVVNSTTDADDESPGDGRCDTGVTIGSGDPECSVRAAIQEAQAQGAGKEIAFNISPEDVNYDSESGIFTIDLERPLPVIAISLTLDARTQPGFIDTPVILISGAGISGYENGLIITADNTTVAGLVISRFRKNGIHIQAAQQVVLETLRIGKHPVSEDPWWENWENGILLDEKTSMTEIKKSIIAGNRQSGIFISEGSNNTIGSSDPAEMNQIFENGEDGVFVLNGTANEIGINSIQNNAGLGINLDEDGDSETMDLVTPNDFLDADEGANQLQNQPTIISYTGGELRGVLMSRPEASFTLRFYQSQKKDDEDFAEGADFLGSLEVTTDSTGKARFSIILEGYESTQIITATATDEEGNTSEFSTPPIIINSTDVAADANAGDGMCDTGSSINREGSDEPECTLRAAIEEINGLGKQNTAYVDIPGNGPFIVYVQDALPEIATPLELDATSQPGYEEGNPKFTIYGGSGDVENGLRIVSGEVVLRGIVVENFTRTGINAGFTDDELNTAALILEDVRSIRNGTYGLYALGNVRATGLLEASDNGQNFDDPFDCLDETIAGIYSEGSVKTENLIINRNCGVGGWFSPEINVNGNVEVSSNTGPGLFIDGRIPSENPEVKILGEEHAFNKNGHEGLWVGPDDIYSDWIPVHVKITGNISANENGQRSAIALKEANVTHSGRNVPNGFSGISVRDQLEVHGNITSNSNYGSGIYAGTLRVFGNVSSQYNRQNGLNIDFQMYAEGEEHDISENYWTGLSTANAPGNSERGITLLANKSRIYRNGFRYDRASTDLSQEECRRIGEAGLSAGLASAGGIFIENAEITFNCGDAISDRSPFAVELSGNTTIHSNTFGIDSREMLIFGEGNHQIFLNYFGGVYVKNARLIGNVSIQSNNTWYRDNESTECSNGNTDLYAFGLTGKLTGSNLQVNENCGFGLLDIWGHAEVDMESLSTVGNSGSGIVLAKLKAGNLTSTDNERFGVIIRGGHFVVQNAEIARNGLGGLRGAAPNTSAKVIASGEQIIQIKQSESRIEGSRIYDNNGPGILIESGLPVVIKKSEIVGNQGLNIDNKSEDLLLTDDIWWGDASGPGQTISEGIVVKKNRVKPLDLVSSVGLDSVFVLPGNSDTLLVSVRNWASPVSQVSVAKNESKAWLPELESPIFQLDSSGVMYPLVISVPGNAEFGKTTTAELVFTNQENEEESDTVSFIVVAGLSTNNQAPRVLVPLTNQSVIIGEQYAYSVNLESVFHEVDGEQLAYSFSLSDTSRAKGSIRDIELEIVFRRAGEVVLKINAEDNTGKKAEISATLRGIPDVPLLVSPRENTRNVPPDTLLEFSSVEAADHYQLQVDVSDDFASPFVDSLFSAKDLRLDSVRGTFSIPVFNLPESSKILWRVRALQSEIGGSWSEAMLFETIMGGLSSGEEVPAEFALHQNYPNPFNPSTVINYELAEGSFIQLAVFDVLGRKIKTLVDNEFKQAGRYRVVFESSALSSGVYIYRLTANEVVLTKRMLFIK